MNVLSHGMLLGARGNSGVILSQFFAGISKGFEGTKKADPLTLGHALEVGVHQAYTSVMTPTEGTILTVAREAVEYAVKSITPQSTIRSFFADLVKECHASLNRTPEILNVLKEAGVVDSGGAGLVYIMDGFNRVLNGEDIAFSRTVSEIEAKASSPLNTSFGPDSVMEYGYCTELLIQLMNAKTDIEAFDVEPLKEFLASIGNSIVCFKTDSIVKLHVHTHTPEKVLEYCRSFGEFITIKIENMSVQHSVTEEAADEGKTADAEISAEFVPAAAASEEKKRYGVVAVCIGDGIEALFRDLGCDEVVPGGQTQNPSINDFLSAFEKVNAEHIFVFPNNSNILMAARQAGEMYENAEIHVIPSKNIGTGYVALSVLDFENPDVDMVIDDMQQAMQRVTAGYVSPSIRDAEINGIKISKGDTIGIIEKEIVVSESDKMNAAYSIAVQLLENFGKFMLSVFCGKDTTEDEKQKLRQQLSEKCPSAEVYFIDGGQDIYPYIFVAE